MVCVLNNIFLGPILGTWFSCLPKWIGNCIPSEVWVKLLIHFKLQKCNGPINGCNYLSTPELKLIYASKGGFRWRVNSLGIGIHFAICDYRRVLELFSFNQKDLQTLSSYTCSQSLSRLPSCSSDWMRRPVFFFTFQLSNREELEPGLGERSVPLSFYTGIRHLVIQKSTMTSQITGNSSGCLVVWFDKHIKGSIKSRVTGPLRGESTGDRWIPLTWANNAESVFM